MPNINESLLQQGDCPFHHFNMVLIRLPSKNYTNDAQNERDIQVSGMSRAASRAVPTGSENTEKAAIVSNITPI